MGDIDLNELERWTASLTRTQVSFIAWNAERLHISREESRVRYFRSWTTYPGGHAGDAFRALGERMHRTLDVLFGDGPDEVFDAYDLHGPMHFLRMLAYPDPVFAEDHPIVRLLGRQRRIGIVDFGCGLAQYARAMAQHLGDRGIAVDLTLVDIPTVRKPFLLWLGHESRTLTTFLDCTAEQPIPTLPTCDLCVATEVFEHFHQPLRYLQAIEAALRSGGLLLTNVADHAAEPFHVSPKLDELRAHLEGGAFRSVVRNRLYQKI
ncbi:hypothetical protein BAL199_11986 [alpha proteobacterium BAL199]|jgi:SAM-dependent methyltransferase|nr:hypothetical protein BAL199_11986 [alpha proteobacterium BAL199]